MIVSTDMIATSDVSTVGSEHKALRPGATVALAPGLKLPSSRASVVGTGLRHAVREWLKPAPMRTIADAGRHVRATARGLCPERRRGGGADQGGR